MQKLIGEITYMGKNVSTVVMSFGQNISHNNIVQEKIIRHVMTIELVKDYGSKANIHTK